MTRSCTSHGSSLKLTYLSNHVKSSLCLTSAAMCLYLWTSFGPHFFTSFFFSFQLLQPDSGVWCSSVRHREPDGRDSNLSCPWFFLSSHHNSAFFRLLHVCALFQLTCISVQNLFGTSFSLKTLTESKEFLVRKKVFLRAWEQFLTCSVGLYLAKRVQNAQTQARQQTDGRKSDRRLSIGYKAYCFWRFAVFFVKVI